MVTASLLTATGTPTVATPIPATTAIPTLATAIPAATATPTLATAIPVATATPTETKGIATAAATKGTTATTKGTAMAETEGTAPAITGYRKSDRYRGDAANKWRLVKLPPFEIAFMLLRFDHVARFIVNANHSVM